MVGQHSDALELYARLLETMKFDTNCYFNYLVLMWQGGVKSDHYILAETAMSSSFWQSTFHESYLSLMWGLV